MVLSTEYSEAVNARYTFQPLWVSGSKKLAKFVLETNNSSKANYPSETDKSSVIRLGKSELDTNVDLSLCGLAPAQSQMDLFLDKLCALCIVLKTISFIQKLPFRPYLLCSQPVRPGHYSVLPSHTLRILWSKYGKMT